MASKRGGDDMGAGEQSRNATGRRALSRRKRVVFIVLSLLVAAGTVELVCAAALLVVGGEWSYESIHAAQTERAGGREWENTDYKEAVHPYLGYVLDPDRVEEANALGFRPSDNDIPRRAPGRVVVGVTGGSVAMQFCQQAGEEFKQALGARLGGTEVVLTSLALPGYKQPQQVMAVNYLACLGAEFDVVLNLDGFNEVALPPTEDPDGRMTDVYPRWWFRRFPALHDERDLELRLRGLMLRTRQRELAATFGRPPLRYCATALVYWRCRDGMLIEGQRAVADDMLAYEEPGVPMPYARRGAGNDWTSADERAERLVDDWAACSRQLRRVCTGMGAAYVHALQPNQYVPDSKPLSDEEQHSAVLAHSQYLPAVRTAYPLLQVRGRQLQAEGEHFVDLTQVFAGVPDTVYSDECCHLNKRGHLMLCERLAPEVARALGQ